MTNLCDFDFGGKISLLPSTSSFSTETVSLNYYCVPASPKNLWKSLEEDEENITESPLQTK